MLSYKEKAEKKTLVIVFMLFSLTKLSCSRKIRLLLQWVNVSFLADFVGFGIMLEKEAFFFPG